MFEECWGNSKTYDKVIKSPEIKYEKNGEYSARLEESWPTSFARILAGLGESLHNLEKPFSEHLLVLNNYKKNYFWPCLEES